MDGAEWSWHNSFGPSSLFRFSGWYAQKLCTIYSALKKLLFFSLRRITVASHDDMGSYGKDSQGCFRASDALGRFSGLTSRRWETKSTKPWSPIGNRCLRELLFGMRYSSLLLSWKKWKENTFTDLTDSSSHFSLGKLPPRKGKDEKVLISYLISFIKHVILGEVFVCVFSSSEHSLINWANNSSHPS